MKTGTVKWFNETKGYGFIEVDGENNDVFVHKTAVIKAGLQTLRENDKVSFDLEENNKGKFSAVDIAMAK